MQRLSAGDLSQTHCGRERRDSAVVNEEFTVPWKVFVCLINIPGKSPRLPRDASAVGCNQAGCLSNAARIGCLYIIFEEYKLACSIAFELPPTHLHIAFCSREEWSHMRCFSPPLLHTHTRTRETPTITFSVLAKETHGHPILYCKVASLTLDYQGRVEVKIYCRDRFEDQVQSLSFLILLLRKMSW